MKKVSVKSKLIDYLNEPHTVQECYEELSEEKHHTIRARLNENINKCFRRLTRGLYIAIQGETRALIVEGDAWESIKLIEDNSIDCIITDSPYTSMDHHYATGTTRHKELNALPYETKDIDEPLLQDMFRVLKKGGHFFSFMPSDNKDTLDFNDAFIALARKVGFDFNKRFIWNKDVIGMGYNGRCKYEQIMFLSKGKRIKPFDLSIPDLLTHKRIPSKKRIHHAEKPVELIMDLLRFSTQENDVALDLFAGSWSLLRAGMELNRHTISFEIDPEMVQYAVENFGAVNVTESGWK
jgi:site-specific DNA-methyltransferase (adenine-specific)